MEIFEASYDLVHVTNSFHLGETLSSFDKIVQALIGTEFQQNVDVILIFEKVLKSDNALVLYTSVYFDLAH